MHSSQATVEPVCAKVPSRKAKKHMDSQSKKNTAQQVKQQLPLQNL